jgi:hypothetical protein
VPAVQSHKQQTVYSKQAVAMRQQVNLLLLGLAVLMLAPQPSAAGFCFPSLVDMLAAKSVALDK